MTLRSSDLQSDSDLDSIRNSCDVFFTEPFYLVKKPRNVLNSILQCKFYNVNPQNLRAAETAVVR